MASSALSIFKGVAAAAAGMAGEKVAKTGDIPGLDLATILPALLGKGGGAGGILGTLASVVSKTGLLNSSNVGKLVELAGSLLSLPDKAGGAKKTAATGIAGLAAAIAGGTGSGTNLASIASLATKVASKAKDAKGLTTMASELGKTLNGKFGISFEGPATAIKALDKVLEGDTKSKLFTSILKGLV